ncbi:MAG: hypothetical protein KatS3mg082_1918 [Nitrospiraceae bacterium]|nr:MAG: hypothetical protein KatS3mg082_1918 [Nitrospiraceae bacterium]
MAYEKPRRLELEVRHVAQKVISRAPRFPWTLICDKGNQYVQHETSGFRARLKDRRATEAGPESGRASQGRWSAKRKMSVVLELLLGADLESTSRKYGVTAATLSEWREAFRDCPERR